jgi:hypothetical protein
MILPAQSVRYLLVFLVLALSGVYGLWFFGILSFANPSRLLASPRFQDRMDGLILIAEKGPEGGRWRDQVVNCLENEEDAHVREMAIITLRELGKSPDAVSSLREIFRREKDAEIRASLENLLFQWKVPLPD